MHFELTISLRQPLQLLEIERTDLHGFNCSVICASTVFYNRTVYGSLFYLFHPRLSLLPRFPASSSIDRCILRSSFLQREWKFGQVVLNFKQRSQCALKYVTAVSIVLIYCEWTQQISTYRSGVYANQFMTHCRGVSAAQMASLPNSNGCAFQQPHKSQRARGQQWAKRKDQGCTAQNGAGCIQHPNKCHAKIASVCANQSINQSIKER